MLSDHTSPYNLSFTSASLRPELMRIAAAAFLELGGWEAAREQILSRNAFQCRTIRSASRLEVEIRRRLQLLTHPQLTLLVEATAEDRAALAWLAACKRSRFLFDFAAEALRDKLDSRDPVLRPSDYETYADLQSAVHPELNALTPSSRVKIRQVLFLMLEEAGLLSRKPAMRIHRPVLSPSVLQAILSDSPQWLAGFLMPDHQIPRS